MLRTGPEDCLSHTNPECRCGDRQTTRCTEERMELRGGEVGEESGEVGEVGRQTKCRESGRTAS